MSVTVLHLLWWTFDSPLLEFPRLVSVSYYQGFSAMQSVIVIKCVFFLQITLQLSWRPAWARLRRSQVT